jgi:LSD1 subclass zinc finger protein
VIRFSCPHCKARIEAKDEKMGQQVACPGCRRPLVVPKEPKIKFRCPLCGAVHERLARFGGEIMLCPSCRERIESPRQPPAAVAVETAPVIAEIIADTKPKGELVPVVNPPRPVVLPAPAPPPVQEVVAPPPPSEPVEYGWVHVKVSAHLLNWPDSCAQCLGTADDLVEAYCRRTSPAGRVETNCWRVPYCRGCASRVRSGASGESVVYVRWFRSVHEFAFWNRRYAATFIAANLKKVLRA